MVCVLTKFLWERVELIFFLGGVVAFDVPKELLKSLVVKGSGQDIAPLSEPLEPTEDEKFKEFLKGPDPTSGMSCTLCGVKSKTVQEQRSHARSDVHRFNMKRKIRKEPPVSEVEFEKMIEGTWPSLMLVTRLVVNGIYSTG